MRTTMRNSGLGIRNFSRPCGTQPPSGGFKTRQTLLKIFLGHLCLSLFICGAMPLSPIFADTPKPTIVFDKSLPKVTVIPNPARGKKLNFRVMAAGPCKVRIRVNNRFFDVIATIEKEGGSLFDILWNLKTVSEGIYYYQAQIEDKATGQITKLPLQKFVVLK